MPQAINTALSALGAFLRKQDVTADNIANVNTNDFKKRQALLKETAPEGVTVTISTVDAPGSPLPPDEIFGKGREMSNVSLEEEFVDLILNARGFEANLKTIEAEEEMSGTLLDILA